MLVVQVWYICWWYWNGAGNGNGNGNGTGMVLVPPLMGLVPRFVHHKSLKKSQRESTSERLQVVEYNLS